MIMGKFLLALFAVMLATRLQAATTTESFETVSIVDAEGKPLQNAWSQGSGLSNGWKVVGGNIVASAGSSNYGLWTKAHTGQKSLEASYSSTNKSFVVITQKLSGELKFWARKTSSSSSSKGTLKILEVAEADGSYTESATLATYNLTTTWTEYTLDLGTEGKLVAINMVRAGIDDITYTTFEAATTPQMTVTMDGETVKTGYTHDFGLADHEVSDTLRLRNSGVGTLNATLKATEGYALSATTVALQAGTDTAIAITQKAETTGLKHGQINISAPELDTLTLNLQGLVRDTAKIYVNFDSFPDGWTLNNPDYATIEDGTLKASYLYAAEITSPMISVGEGEQLYFRYKSAASSSYQVPTVNLFYSSDAAEWTQVGENIAANADQQWRSALVSGVPTSARYIKISAKYVSLDDLYGFSLPQEAIMRADVSDIDFGMTTKDSTRTFVISNLGTKALTGLKATVSDTAFTVSLPESIAAKAEGTLTVAMKASEQGLHRAVVTLTAEKQDTVSFATEGYVINPEAMLVSFDGDSLPRGWHGSGWTVAQGKASAGYGARTPNTITTARLTVSKGDELAIRANREYDSGFLRLYSSDNQGREWTLLRNFAPELKTDTMTTLVVNGLSEGSVTLRFDGSYANIEAINGLHIDQNAPIMELRGEGKALISNGDSIDYGITSRPLTHIYNVANTGTGTLKVRISVADSTQFAVSDSLLCVAQDSVGQLSVTLPMGQPYGKKATVLTIRPGNEGLEPISITLTGETRDSTLWTEDFENGITTPWTNHGWTTETPYYGNGTKMAFATSADTTYIITPRLKAKKGDRLIYQALLPWTDETMKVEYSTDEQATWTVDSIYQFANNYTLANFEFTAPADGFYFIRFSGGYSYVDNFYGFRYASKAHEAEISSVDMPERVYQYADNKISATIHELNGRNETVNATLLVDGTEAQTIDSVALKADSTRQFNFNYRTELSPDSLTLQVRFTYGGDTLTTSLNTVAVVPAPVVSEEGGFALTADSYPALKLRFSAVKGWNTVALPFALDSLSLLNADTIYAVTGLKDNQLLISARQKLEAGQPYLLHSDSALTVDTVLYHVTVSAPSPLSSIAGGSTFYATYDSIRPTGHNILVLSADSGCFVRPAEDATVRALHAYIDSQNGESCLYLLSDDGRIATTVRAVDAGTKADGRTYDLGGRLISGHNMGKGVYIKNGKKIIKK